MESEDSEQPLESKEGSEDASLDTSNDQTNLSVSPKISRPKLPEFIGNERGCPTQHTRAKTDPGQGAEIKAIIDKTMEDIKELQQVDFTKTYSRPRVFPKPFLKSQSTHTSPRASPIQSPSVEENPLLNRNRSRSLKVLTDMLKSGRAEPRHNIPKDDSMKSISDSQLLFGKKAKYDSERRSESDGYLGSPNKLTVDVHNDTQQTDKFDTEKIRRTDSYKSQDIKSPRRGRRTKSEITRPVLSDDEGLEMDNELGPHSSHKPLGHTETNSQFLMFYKIGAPKRRPAYAGLMPLNKTSSSPESGKSEEPNYKRLQRVELRPFNHNGRKSMPARHVTHPPQSKSTFPLEHGSVDSNGFGSLQKTSPSDETPPMTFELEAQPSDLSLADSQLGQSVTSEDVASVVSENPTECEYGEKQDKKRGTKQKSKSDPSGSKSIENMPEVISSSHSSPVLSNEEDILSKGEEILPEDKETLSKDEETLSKDEEILCKDEEMIDKDIMLHESKNTDMITDLDNEDQVSTTKSAIFQQSHSQSFDESKSRQSSCSDLDDNELTSSAPLYVSNFSFNEDSSPTTPTNLSPLPAQFLSVPTNKKNIARSVSSASVLQRERKFLEKENLRKHSIASDDGMLFPPSLGDVQSTSMPTLCKNEDKDKRYHIVEELYRNEKEYVDALSTLKDKYMMPLKMSSNVDETILNNIFYMLPEILMHHTVYRNSLDKVWSNWDTKTSTVGNVIMSTFSKNTVLDCYMSFVENFKTSGKEIENILQNKSSIQKFIEQCHRDSGSKLTMKDLIVRPIQRIPRCELLVQRLLENTPVNHPDHALLKEADRVLHNFATKLGNVDESRQEEDCQDSLKRLELLLLTELLSPDRQYLRHDMVQIISKKDQCCVWTFSDLIIISSVKRRSGTVPRKSIILKSPTGQDFAENVKQKVWLRIGLDDVEIVKNESKLNRKPSIDPDQLENDIQRLNEINNITTQLTCQHSELDDVLKDLQAALNKQLSEVQARMRLIDSNKLDIIVTTQEGVFPWELCFSSSEKRSSWESTFYEAKQRLAILSNKRAPEFLQPLQITKTRAGMQFSCAAPIDGVNCSGYRDVWVCNSDGYVGHMCLLSLQPEPIVVLNTPVPGCNARILCICAVPAYNGIFKRKSSSKKGKTRPSVLEDNPTISVEEVDDQEPDEEGYQSDEESSEEEEEFSEHRDLYVNEIEVKRPPPSDLTQSSPDTITLSGNWTQDAFKSTMWLGTEDGCIHIFQCTDNIKTTKNKLKIHHGSPVYCIVYLDNKVFVSLANGDLIVYKRDSEGIWDTENPYTRTIGSGAAPISRMLAVAGKLWCGCQNMMNIINPLTLRIESSYQVTSDCNRCVQCMVTAGQGVWIGPQHSSKVLLYHATSYEFLLEVNIAQAVAQKLQSADDIIRQHKAACLRITALLVCKDLLWIGTSAGVILTIPMPRITSTTTRGVITTPSVTGLVYGHTGHVRFLTSVEMNATTAPPSPSRPDNDEELPENLSFKDMPRRSSVAATTATMATRMLVISGGDGYEDFRNNTANESAGRDDSTNHLLLWHV